MLIFTSQFYPLYAQLLPKSIYKKSLGRSEFIKKTCHLCCNVLQTVKNRKIRGKMYFSLVILMVGGYLLIIIQQKNMCFLFVYK